ncbi:MAG: M23 family metallopeptidase [Planctomycetes bacterium]|nr:M23 family metallopeptidase [Planctomycetota bacterium]
MVASAIEARAGGAALGAAGGAVPRSPEGRRRRLLVGVAGGLLGVFLLACVAPTGPEDPASYPPRAESPYLLPWPAGVLRFCVQGNRGVVSHRGRERFAYDFAMPVGSQVCAARAGTVMRVVVTHTGRGTDKPNNLIGVDHGDGTTGWYLHLRKGGSRVAVGERVLSGQVIAESGNVGRSMLPHLHFHVTGADGATQPVTFRDVAADYGIPRMFSFYRSGNRAPEEPGAEAGEAGEAGDAAGDGERAREGDGDREGDTPGGADGPGH